MFALSEADEQLPAVARGMRDNCTAIHTDDFDERACCHDDVLSTLKNAGLSAVHITKMGRSWRRPCSSCIAIA